MPGCHAELQDNRGFPQQRCICAAGSLPAKASPGTGLKRPDQRIAACRRPLDEADAGSEDGADSGEDPELAAKIGDLVERRKHKQSLRESLQASGERRMSEADADARR